MREKPRMRSVACQFSADLDTLCAHLYGLTCEELAYILGIFLIVRWKDEERYREYRTKRMVLEAYGELESLIR